MKKNIILFAMLQFSVTVFAQEIFISGTQQSVIEYTLEQTVEVPAGLHELTISFVEPADFNSKTYQQEVQELSFKFTPDPDKEDLIVDKNSNRVRMVYWNNPHDEIKFQAVIKTNNQVNLQNLQSTASFPVRDISPDLSIFLESTELVQSSHPDLVKRAREVTANSQTEFEAVQKILYLVVEHLRYVLIPEKFDALYSLQTGRGNCQNYSHLTAALLRAVGIPVRIVNGITFKRAYSIPMEQAEYSFEMAEGRHSWIEVYFSDLGWMPFDPQQTEFFVSNRYLRVEVGRDNEETIQDGLVKWVRSGQGNPEVPRLAESIVSNFLSDRVDFRSEKKILGIKKLLLAPPLQQLTPAIAERETEIKKKVAPPADQTSKEGSEKPAISSDIDYTKLKYSRPVVIGNLDFPIQFDFLSARLADSRETGSISELKRNFIVETAEYVTGKEQFSQLFVLDQPMALKNIGLALHQFGGDGLIWIDLSDDENGAPARTGIFSKKILTRHIPPAKGYDWIDFDFSSENLLLSPGKYWITLYYSGTPIVNWFYSYGKPVGPVEGTRSREFNQREWGKILSFEFNYRVQGLASQE
jgi:transglutaminase-like putative cysteine protease